MQEINPKQHENFWCNKCDANTVDSLNPDSGKFFVQFGHCFSARTRSYDGEYTGVMFALCPNCLPK